jgi:integrase
MDVPAAYFDSNREPRFRQAWEARALHDGKPSRRGVGRHLGFTDGARPQNSTLQGARMRQGVPGDTAPTVLLASMRFEYQFRSIPKEAWQEKIQGTTASLLRGKNAAALWSVREGKTAQAGREITMGVYKRGGVYWYEFEFQGQRIRESAKTSSKTIARDAERQRRRELELGINRLEQPKRMPLFKLAAEQWLLSLSGLAEKSLAAYRQYVRSLSGEFGDRLICDIGLDDIVRLQRQRLAEGKSPRTANYETHALRLILKHFNLWWPLADKVRMLKGERQPGRALSREEESRLIGAIRKCGSPALEPLFIVSIDSGLRASEIRNLRRGDVALSPASGSFEGEIVVRRSKTEAGTGRVVPLTRRAAAALATWLSSLPEAGPEAYVFPRHQVGFGVGGQGCMPYGIDFSRPMQGWKSAWSRVRRVVGVKARWHDLRHTLVSRLAENPAISEETIRALAGHVSRQMLSRYAYIRAQAKRAAIQSLDGADFEAESPQNPPQPAADEIKQRFTITEKTLN